MAGGAGLFPARRFISLGKDIVIVKEEQGKEDNS